MHHGYWSVAVIYSLDKKKKRIYELQMLKMTKPLLPSGSPCTEKGGLLWLDIVNTDHHRYDFIT